MGGVSSGADKNQESSIDGKETGIYRLAWILRDVASLNITNDESITDEIIKCVQQFNYIPVKKMTEFKKALLQEYKMMAPGERRRQKREELRHA